MSAVVLDYKWVFAELAAVVIKSVAKSELVSRMFSHIIPGAPYATAVWTSLRSWFSPLFQVANESAYGENNYMLRYVDSMLTPNIQI